MTNLSRLKAAEALFPLLSAFHEINGSVLKTVRQEIYEDSHVGIVLDFESKSLIIRANPEDDTVDFFVVASSAIEKSDRNDVSQTFPWKQFIGKEFGWGWVSVNQQGYLDGLILSFGGIIPDLIVTVIASSLKLGSVQLRAEL